MLVMSNRERYLDTRVPDGSIAVQSWLSAAAGPAVLRRMDESDSYVRG